MNKTILKTKSDFEVLKTAKFTVALSPKYRAHRNEGGFPDGYVTDTPGTGYDIEIRSSTRPLANYQNVPEAELDTALIEFQELHGKHDMIQVLSNGEERPVG